MGRPPKEDTGVLYCGVRDYAEFLSQALRDIGIDAEVLAPRTWALKDVFDFTNLLRAMQLDVLHLQYPSIGHRFSLLPHLLGLTGVARRFIVTLHEHSAITRLQRAANALFRLTADRIVFVTEYEALAFGATALGLVIPIGSNVPIHASTLKRDDTVLYFGQIRAGKGLEAFIDLARLADNAAEPGRFLVIGSTPPRWHDYAQALRSNAPARVSWMENAPAEAIAEVMASASSSYLPFPDGASLRRGSLLAALANGLPVIAPFGNSTTDELRTVLFAAATPEQALAQVRMIKATPKAVAQRTIAGRRLVQRFSWEGIADQHKALYCDILAGRMRQRLCPRL